MPVRGDFTRGIFASVYTGCDLSEEGAFELYEEFYKGAAFTFVSPRPVDLKQVVNTNKCLVSLEKHGGKLVTILVYNAGDDSYDVIPEYNIIGESNGKVYIAAYPTDVQFDESDKKSYSDYMAVLDEVSKLKEGTEGCPLVFNN